MTDTTASGFLSECVDDQGAAQCTQTAYAYDSVTTLILSAVVSNGTFEISGLSPETEYAVYAINEDGDGNQTGSENLVEVTTQASLPPPPPPPDEPQESILDKSAATPFADSMAFLFEGADPVQTGVAPGTINAQQAGAVRGRILSGTGTPLASVRVSVKDRPELGQTFTRADGVFDLVVNGGGTLVLEYERGGYISLFRRVSVGWHAYLELPDSVMIPRDGQATVIDLSGGSAWLGESVVELASAGSIGAALAMRAILAQVGGGTSFQVAQGSIVADGGGQRQITLLFEEGTIATTEAGQDLDTLTIRSTEFTQGGFADFGDALPSPPLERIQQFMVFDIGADEAVALGAARVDLTKNVRMYVENFQGLDVGESVKLSELDDGNAAWVGRQTPGRVLQITNIVGGVAEIDATGDGVAESPTVLQNQFNLPPEEAAVVGSMYPVGQQLVRLQLNALGKWCPHQDFPYADDATTLSGGEPAPPPCEGSDCTCKQGSTIQVERQCMGERIDVVGSPYDLHYKSDRVVGNRSGYTLEIPVTGATVPDSLLKVEVTIRVAGRTIALEAPAAMNETVAFTWDGKDAFGRVLQGRQPVEIRTSWVYEGEASIFVTAAKSRIWRGHIGGWDNRAAGIGGWTLAPHHAYDPEGKTLYRGNSVQRSAENLGLVVETITGGGTDLFGLGIPAEQKRLGRVEYVAAGSDGSIFLSGHEGGVFPARVLRIAPNGLIEAFAGTGTLGFSGDGGPAVSATLNGVRGLAVASDGSVYLADASNHRVRHVGPDGIIRTVVGSGSQGSLEDDDPLVAELNTPFDVAVRADGVLFVADKQNGRIRRLGLDGKLVTVAGNGSTPAYSSTTPADGLSVSIGLPQGVDVDDEGNLYIASFGKRVYQLDTLGQIRLLAGASSACGEPGTNAIGDGCPAEGAMLSETRDVVVAPDGSLYISEFDGHRIRRVGPDGLASTLAGNGLTSTEVVGGSRATAARLNQPSGLAIAPNGDLLIADGVNHRIRRVGPALPGFSIGDILVPSADGSEVYLFDPAGKHRETRDALTGTTLLTFEYTTPGTLNTIADSDNNVTQVLRDGSGNPTGIKPPFAAATTVTLDAKGYLATVMNPAGNQHLAQYSTEQEKEGLLIQFTPPGAQGNFTFAYDAIGRLLSDTDPESGVQTLEQLDADGVKIVEHKTALDRPTLTTIETLITGEELRTVTDAAGFVTETVEGSDGVTEVTTPDGTVVKRTEEPDPRFGSSAPIQGEFRITTPGGLQFDRNQSREVSLDPQGELLSQTDTIVVNERTSEVAWDASTRKVTTTTAALRLLIDTLDPTGRLEATQVDGLEEVRLGYDTAGRLLNLSQGQGAGERVVTFAYDTDGNLASVTDPLSRSVTFDYDLAGRVTKQTLPDLREILFSYDARGNLTSLTPPGQPAHLFRYTGLDQEEEYEPPVLATVPDPRTLFTYDLDRNLQQVARPGGSTITLGYDSAGRLATVTTPRGVTTQTYDPATGTIESISAPGGEALGFTYDGSLVTGTTWGGTVAGSVSQTYDDDFRIATQSVNGANTIAFGYDLDGLLTAAGALSLTRDSANGLLTTTTLGSVATSQTYNDFGELAMDVATVAGTEVYKNVYTRDALGRITHKVETIQGTITIFDYVYDLAGRLETVTIDGSLARTYAYDPNGNRLSLTDHTQGGAVTSATYDDQDRLVSYGTLSFTYNAAGDLMSQTDSSLPAGDQMTTYTYDPLGNLVQVVLPDDRIIEYVIDGQNRRVGKKVDGVLVQGWFYQDQLNPVAELDSGGNVVRRYVYATSSVSPDYVAESGATLRLIADNLGSPRLLIDSATGQVLGMARHDEFGVPQSPSEEALAGFGFAGGLADNDLDTIRFGARDYLPGAGRWTAKDPVRFAGFTTNLYSYAFNNPVGLQDASGLMVGDPVFCAKLARRIANVEKRISKRIGQLDENPLNLPETCPGDDTKPSLSRRGHRRLINEDKNLLASLRATYAATCMGPPPVPNPAPSPEDVEDAGKGLTLGALLLLLLFSVLVPVLG